MTSMKLNEMKSRKFEILSDSLPGWSILHGRGAKSVWAFLTTDTAGLNILFIVDEDWLVKKSTLWQSFQSEARAALPSGQWFWTQCFWRTNIDHKNQSVDVGDSDDGGLQSVTAPLWSWQRLSKSKCHWGENFCQRKLVFTKMCTFCSLQWLWQ